MNRRFWIATCLLTSFAALAVSAAPRPAASRRKPVAPTKKKPAQQAATATRPMTPEEARTAVAMLGDAYDLILEEAHSIYHTRPNVPVAATVVRKVQAHMAKQGWPKARFLAVNAIVMHPDHVAKDDFERETVQTLKRSNERIEQVVEGNLRVATVVPLGGGCSSCHWTGSGTSAKAATTWSVPLRKTSAHRQ